MNLSQISQAYSSIQNAGYAFENIAEKAKQDKDSKQTSEHSIPKKDSIQPETTSILTPSAGIDFKQAALLVSETVEKIQSINRFLRHNLHQSSEFHFLGSIYV